MRGDRLSFELPGVRGEGRVALDHRRPAHHGERVYGNFERTVQLPMAVQAEKVKTTYHDGVLEVKLPKSEEVEPKEIKIDIL